MADCIHLWGIVVDDTTSTPLEGVQVEASVRTTLKRIVLDTTRTNSDGHFTVDLSDAAGHSVVLFELTFGTDGHVRTVTSDNATWRENPPNGCTFTLADVPTCITGPAEPQDTPPLVYGSVVNTATGLAVPNGPPWFKVQLYERNLGSEASVGSPVNVTGGEYKILYTGTRDVFVRLTRISTVLYTSPIVPQASGRTKINIEFCHAEAPADTEFARVFADVDPIVASIDVSTLDPEDFALVAQRSQQPLDRVTAFLFARRMNETTVMQASPAVTDGEETLYGLLRQNFPYNLGRLLRSSVTRLKVAIEAAADDGVIATSIGDDAQARAEELKAKAVERSKSGVPGEFSLHQILQILVSSTDADNFVQTLATFTDTSEAFWAAVSITTPGVTTDDVRKLVRLARLCLAHRPLVEELWNTYSAPAVEDLAPWGKVSTTPNWTAVVQSVTPTFPKVVQGADDAAKEANYIDYLYREVHRANPGVAVTRKLAATSGTNWKVWLNANPLFDFETDDVDVAAVSETEDLRKGLRRTQRLFRVAPRSSDMAVVITSLDGAGYDSARSIVAGGRKRFLSAMSSSLGADVAAEVHAMARRQASMASALFGVVHPRLMGPSLAFVGGAVEPSAYSTIPTYETLFGSLDTAACEHCMSVYSPAAYLADLMHWLDERGALTDLVAADRRPDLQTLTLNCHNALTGMPYVDLALEIMEAAVLARKASSTPALVDLIPTATKADTPALLAKPEYVLQALDGVTNKDAYAFVASATYPRTPPYDHHLGLLRSHLAHFDLPPYRLWETLTVATQPNAAEIGAEVLGLTPGVRTALLISGVDVKALYSTTGAMPGPLTGPTVSVQAFLDNQQVTYPELLDLVHSRFGNAWGHLDIVATGMTLADLNFSAAPPSDDSYAAASILLRLRQAIGWSMFDLDTALTALLAAPPTITDPALIDLANVARLHDSTGLPVAELCAWFADMDTYGDREREEPAVSIYDQVFQDASVFDAATLARFDAGTIPNGETLSGNVDPIRAATGLNAEDYDLAASGLTDSLTLANLSHLFRHASVARQVGLSVRELLGFTVLLGVDPFSSPSDARAFLDELRFLGRFDLTVDQAYYLCAHEAEAETRVGVADSWIEEVLDRLRDELTAITDKVEGSPPPVQAQCRDSVSAHVPADQLEALVAIIDGSTALGETAQHDTWDASNLTAIISTTDATTNLITPATEITELHDRFVWVIDQIEAYELEQQLETAVVEVLATALGVDADLMTILRACPFPAPISGDFVLVFTDAGFLDKANEASYFGPLEILYKATWILDKLGVDADELTWWLNETIGSNFTGSFDLAVLSATEETNGATIASNYGALRNTFRVFSLRERFAGTSPTFASLMDSLTAGSVAGFLTNLAERTGWDEGALTDTTSGPSGLQLTTVAAVAPPDVLHRLADVMGLMRRIGVDIATLAGWVPATGTMTFTEAMSSSAIAAARSRHGAAEQWSAVSRQLRNEVRLRARDALADYLVGIDATFGDVDDLYAHFLIDVQMDACMVTSRLKQAISSVQLYVHRCFMGLETATLDREDFEEWEWRHRYRVWEAARKVFLYPENWIEPELRSDTSPFFDDLVDELLQNEITDDNVSEAMLRYLDKLHEVGNLEVLAYHHQFGRDSSGEVMVDTLHVFARTRAEPRRVFLRRWESQLRWTPWERVDLPIKSDQLVPVVVGQRLILFWLDFREAESNYQYWEIALSWAEYREGRWSQTLTSLDTLVTGHRFARDKYHVHWTASGESLTLSVECDFKSGSPQEQIGRFIVDLCTFDASVLQETVHSTTTYTRTVLTIGSFDETVDPPNPIYADATETVTSGAAQGPAADTTITPYKTTIHGNRFRTRVGGTHVQGLTLSVGETYFGWYLDGSVEDIDVLNTLPAERGTWIVATRQYNQFVGQVPFFVQDDTHAWFVTLQTCDDRDTPVSDNPTLLVQSCDETISYNVPQDQGQSWAGTDLQFTDPNLSPAAIVGVNLKKVEFGIESQDSLIAETSAGYRFWAFDHPYTCRFLREVRLHGVMGLLSPDEEGDSSDLVRQAVTDDYFQAAYDPTDAVHPTYPIDAVDFSTRGAYSLYNWEIFFHIPFYVASQLSAQARYADAQRWFHTIFDPTSTSTGTSAPMKYWLVAPLAAARDVQVSNWAAFSGARNSGAAEAFEDQVAGWEADPFDPHAIAAMRPMAYARAVVRKYIENLLAWGDDLFRQDTIETINEATQLYVLAGQILGDRPEQLEARETPTYKSYTDIQTDLDALSNALVKLENSTFTTKGKSKGRIGRKGIGRSSGVRTMNATPSVGVMPYFCVPPNEEILRYWDTVEDRLFKIRHCMNIEGVVRALPLYEPPIDPGALVRAVASGASLGSVLSDTTVTRPLYRFTAVVAKAQAFAGTVRALGGALLSALEKQDAEEIAQLRANHEVRVLEAASDVRSLQVEEARHNLTSAKRSLRSAEQRQTYYTDLIKTGLLKQEKRQEQLATQAQTWTDIGGALSALGGILGAIPDTKAPIVSVTVGGQLFYRVTQGGSTAAHAAASRISFKSQQSARAASNKRREDEWKQQLKLANREIAQINTQIEAAEVRLTIAEKEQRNHRLQLDNAQTVAEWMHHKYTNRKLYSWMVAQLGKVYFQSYQLAHEMARTAERAYQYELGSTAVYVEYGHFDGLRKGLLAGERLQHDLERLEAAYIQDDKRELELTKAVSLMRLDPLALVALRATGECYFEVPEVLFDLDCPGHVYRRLSSVGVTIACVAGGFGQVNMRLTLQSSKVRLSPTGGESPDAPTYPSIVTSTAIEDPGVFSADPNGVRYLPFERLGAVSNWHLAFANQDYPQIDWDTVSDVVLHIRYTARDGGSAYRDTVLSNLPDNLTALKGGFTDLGTTNESAHYVVAISAKRDDPDAWLAAQEAQADSVTLALGTERLPYFAVGHSPTIKKVHALLVGAAEFTADATPGNNISLDGGTGISLGNFTEWPVADTPVIRTDTGTITQSWPTDDITVQIDDVAGTPLTLDAVDDVIVVLEFSVS